jgi:four helix bundle protein
MKLEELNVYRQSMDMAEKVWVIVAGWDYFSKDTVGKQLVKAADSIAANLSEGFGRYHYREKTNFGYYSRGSLYETKTWLRKSFTRGLITDDDYEYLIKETEDIGIRLNNYIRSTSRSNKILTEF